MIHSRTLCTLAASILLSASATSQVIISEFLANNVSGLRDEINEHEDWIEIENTSAATVALSGWYLTDDVTRLRKWPLPAWSIGAGRRIVIFAS